MRLGYWVGVWAACALAAGGQTVPYSFNYQGVLRGGSGELLGTVPKTVEFRLYNQAVNGSVLWGRSYAVLLDTNGLFNVELSDEAGSVLVANAKLQTVIAGNSALYLGLKVSGANEIAPRQQLLAVPFAMMAGDVKQTSGGLTVNGTLTVTNTVKVNAPAAFDGYGTIPIGGIIMWSGNTNTIPSNWSLCNGANGTPDLRDRFVVGAGSNYVVQAKGGTTNVTLTASQIPAHKHVYEDGYFNESLISSGIYTNAQNSALNGGVTDATTVGAANSGLYGSNAHDSNNNYIYWRGMYTSNDGGSGASHENRPPYFALYYIMRMK